MPQEVLLSPGERPQACIVRPIGMSEKVRMDGRQLWIGTAGSVPIHFSGCAARCPQTSFLCHLLQSDRKDNHPGSLLGMVKGGSNTCSFFRKRILRDRDDMRFVSFTGDSDVRILFIYNDVF